MKVVMVLVLALAALASIALLKAYRRVPERELRRQAREGDPLASTLYKAVAYGHSLTTTLWFVVGVTNALFFLVAARSLSTLFAVTLSAAVLWTGYVWLPARKVTGPSTWVAAQLAPAFAWVLNYLHPVIDRASALMSKHWPALVHTGLYDRDDLLELLHYQQTQLDSRVDKSQIDIAMRALTFDDHKVRDLMVPRRDVQMVAATETIGPILMNELHQHGFSYLLVYEDKKENIIGLLRVQDLVGARAGGSVRGLVRPELQFLNEEQPLTDALRAVLKTKQHMYIVVNSFQEFVGIATAQDIFERLVGKPAATGFDAYDDRQAVAAWELQPVPVEMPAGDLPADEPLEEPASDLAKVAVSSMTERTEIAEESTPEVSEVVE